MLTSFFYVNDMVVCLALADLLKVLLLLDAAAAKLVVTAA